MILSLQIIALIMFAFAGYQLGALAIIRKMGFTAFFEKHKNSFRDYHHFISHYYYMFFLSLTVLLIAAVLADTSTFHIIFSIK